ncbi:MAG TPA: hypothetical protein VK827_07595 [Lysobacter sp.]|nr:hypothetical protein [Lysobacter sp.]
MDQRLVSQAQESMRRGQVEQAMHGLSVALGAQPPAPMALKLLARLALHQQQMPLARQALEQARALLPGDAEVHALLAAGASISGDPVAMEAAARDALAIDPGHPIASALLVEHLRDRLRFSEAMQVADRCLTLTPDASGTRLARVGLHLFCGEAAAAEADARAAAASSPSLQARQNACMSLLYMDDAVAAGSAAGSVAPDAVLARHLQLGREIPPLKAPPLRPRVRYRPGSRPLRVGLLSPDLRRHPVGWFVEPLLVGCDRSRIAWCCYSDGAPDATTAILQSHAAAWRDVRGESDARVMQRIRDDAIDVLIDLSGHTHGSRPHLLASRCAPLQLGYLGYLFDTGLAGCDGVIGDAVTLPADTHSARQPLRLPGCFLCYLPPPQAPPVRERDPAAPLTFGSFNHLAKLSPATVALWSRVLEQVPGSRLVMCAMGLADAGVRERIAERFARHGVGVDRLDLRPPNTDLAAFLGQYDDIDIALDPLPFNGGTTTLQALWQGVPVLTWPGERMAARSGASILTAVGLTDCIARDADDFVARAVALAADVDARRLLRRTLRARVTDAGLTDARRFASGFCDLLDQTMAAGTS